MGLFGDGETATSGLADAAVTLVEGAQAAPIDRIPVRLHGMRLGGQYKLTNRCPSRCELYVTRSCKKHGTNIP